MGEVKQTSLNTDSLIISESIQIPTRSPRFKNGKRGPPKSKGYVFVTFAEGVKDLDSIITKFTDYEFKDRKIYLSRPAPRDEAAIEAKKEAAAEAAKIAAASKSADETKPKTEAKAKQSTKPKKSTSASQSSRPTKEKIPFEKGTKSTDTVYLKNLDFNTTAKDLRTFFTEGGEDVRWVSVPFKRLPKAVVKKLEESGTLTKRNKGYAFVKFKLNEGESIEDKISKYQGKSLKERDLQISVAVDVRNVENGDEEGKEEEEEKKPETSE